MNPTLADLINEVLACRRDKELFAGKGGDFQDFQENETLANNALTERLEEIIETKLTQMLKELRP